MWVLVSEHQIAGSVKGGALYWLSRPEDTLALEPRENGLCLSFSNGTVYLGGFRRCKPYCQRRCSICNLCASHHMRQVLWGPAPIIGTHVCYNEWDSERNSKQKCRSNHQSTSCRFATLAAARPTCASPQQVALLLQFHSTHSRSTTVHAEDCMTQPTTTGSGLSLREQPWMNGYTLHAAPTSAALRVPAVIPPQPRHVINDMLADTHNTDMLPNCRSKESHKNVLLLAARCLQTQLCSQQQSKGKRASCIHNHMHMVAARMQ